MTARIVLRPLLMAGVFVLLCALALGLRFAFAWGTFELEVAVGLSSVTLTTLLLMSIVESYGDYVHRVRTHGNGKTEVAEDEASRDALRLAWALMSLYGCVALLHEPNDVERPALVAKHMWMLGLWLMLLNVVRDRISRRRLLRKSWPT